MSTRARQSDKPLRKSARGYETARDLWDFVVDNESECERGVQSQDQGDCDLDDGDSDLQRAMKLSLGEPCGQSRGSGAGAERSSPVKRRCLRKATPSTEMNPSDQLAASLSETLEYLRRERPQEVEAGELRIAIERSLLDWAVQVRNEIQQGATADTTSASEVLGVAEGAGLAEVRAAYKAKALAAHPDKGGDSSEFVRVRAAYLRLMGVGAQAQTDLQRQLALPAGTCDSKDFQLRNHRELVRQKFQEDGVNLAERIAAQGFVLQALKLKKCDLGAANRNEQGELIYNQCFYLSLARSYSDSSSDEVVRDTALSLKRVIEAAVLAEHPDWAGARVGEDVQAFSDFLVYSLGTNPLLSELAVAVFDSVIGSVEIYVGRCFPGRGRVAEQRSNLLTIRYEPGHYTAFVPNQVSANSRPSLRELLDTLDTYEVQCVQTYV